MILVNYLSFSSMVGLGRPLQLLGNVLPFLQAIKSLEPGLGCECGDEGRAAPPVRHWRKEQGWGKEGLSGIL